MKTIESKWACGDCGWVHDGFKDAKECCSPQPEKKYICPECDADYYEYHEARECCKGEA